MKKICFILIMSLFVLNSSVPVSASESIRQQVKNIFANKKKAQRNDLNKIKNVLEKEKKANQEGSSKTETISDAETCLGREEYQYSTAYTLSSTEYFLISEYYKQNKNFDKIILSSYGWQVPYKTANGEHGVASLAPKQTLLNGYQKQITIREKQFGRQKKMKSSRS